MFDIRCISPLDDDWENRDVLIQKAAGKKPHKAGAGKTSAMKIGERDSLWLVPNFDQALELKKRLEQVPGVRCVTIREHDSLLD